MFVFGVWMCYYVYVLDMIVLLWYDLVVFKFFL